MSSIIKTDNVYWLRKIYEALGGSDSTRDLSDINKTDDNYWLEQIYKILAPRTVVTESITEMTAEQLDGLKVGDKVLKVTGNMEHLYLVTYKGEGEGQGIVLTYNACGYGEAVSYDRTATGWEYNSTDVKTYGDEEN